MGLLPAGKRDFSGIAVEQIVSLNHLRQLRQFFKRRRNVEASNRSPEKRGDIRVIAMLGLTGRLAHVFVGTRAFSLCRGDEKFVAVNGEGAGVPVGGNETERLLGNLDVRGCDRLGKIEDSNRIHRRVCGKQIPVDRKTVPTPWDNCQRIFARVLWLRKIERSDSMPWKWQLPNPNWIRQRTRSSRPDSAAWRWGASPARVDPQVGSAYPSHDFSTGQVKLRNR